MSFGDSKIMNLLSTSMMRSCVQFFRDEIKSFYFFLFFFGNSELTFLKVGHKPNHQLHGERIEN